MESSSVGNDYENWEERQAAKRKRAKELYEDNTTLMLNALTEWARGLTRSDNGSERIRGHVILGVVRQRAEFEQQLQIAEANVERERQRADDAEAQVEYLTSRLEKAA